VLAGSRPIFAIGIKITWCTRYYCHPIDGPIYIRI
jgi:hypothetical protein